MGYNATWAGRAMAFQGVLAVVMSPIVARLTTKVDARLLVSFGVGIMSLVSLWRTGFASNMDFWGVSLPQLAQGFAMPFFFIPLTGLAMSSVLPQETASAAGLMNFMRTTAGAFGTSITTTAWENIATVHRTDLVGILYKPQATMDVMTRAGMSAGQALSQVDNLVQSQAVMLATDHVFLITSLVFLAGASAVWIAPKPKVMAAPGGGH
jgi:DHA2 family multidrug resistance protein